MLYDSHQLWDISQTIKPLAELKRNHVCDVIKGIFQKPHYTGGVVSIHATSMQV